VRFGCRIVPVVPAGAADVVVTQVSGWLKLFWKLKLTNADRLPQRAHRCAGLVGPIGVLGVVERECLERLRLLDGRLELVRHARREIQHAAHRIAGIGRRERAVQKIDAFDLFGRDHAPARRGGRVVVADQRR